MTPSPMLRGAAITDVAGSEAYDESGHGTHMTSVIAHSGPTLIEGKPGGTFKGTAPDVDLVVIKAFDVEGQGDLLDIVRGIQWAVDNREKYDIRILNLSLSCGPGPAVSPWSPQRGTRDPAT
jgi:subtilisin family serine protease